MSKTIAFIGAGNMGGAIIRATCRVVDPRKVAIYDVLAEKADALAAETGCVAAGSGAGRWTAQPMSCCASSRNTMWTLCAGCCLR